MLNDVLFLSVVFLSNIVQCITGFAGTVLAMPFSVMTVGISVAKPVLNALGMASSAGVLVLTRKSFDKKEFLKIIAVMLPGLFAGEILGRYFSGSPAVLYKTLGVTVIAFAVINAVMFLKNKEFPSFKPLNALLLISSGIIHGLFVCGGPLLVSYAGVKLRDTDAFRSTLSGVWIVLNGVMLVSDIVNGCFVPSTLTLLGIGLVVLVFAVLLGNLAAKKMSRRLFLLLTYALMLISGASLLLKQG